MKHCHLVAKLFAMVVVFLLLVSCAWKKVPVDASSTNRDESTLQHAEKTKNEVEHTDALQSAIGELCYSFDLSDTEPVMNDGKIVGTYYRQSFRSSICYKDRWKHEDLSDMRNGIFVFPYEMIHDLSARTEILLGENGGNLFSVRKTVALLIWELFENPIALSKDIPVNAMLGFCQEGEGLSCGSQSWEVRFHFMRIGRRPHSQDNSRELLTVKFLP